MRNAFTAAFLMAAAMAIKQLEAEAAMTTMIPIEEACDVCHGEDHQEKTPEDVAHEITEDIMSHADANKDGIVTTYEVEQALTKAVEDGEMDQEESNDIYKMISNMKDLDGVEGLEDWELYDGVLTMVLEEFAAYEETTITAADGSEMPADYDSADESTVTD